MFSMKSLRSLVRDHVATKDEDSRARSVRARRNPVGLERLEERQLLATDTFMVVPGVTGSATAPFAPKGSFELTSFTWGVSHAQTVGATGFSGPISAPNFSITKSFDSASIGLLQEVAAGTVDSTGAKVLVYTAGSNPVEVLEYDFKNLVVTSAQLLSGARIPFRSESDMFSFICCQCLSSGLIKEKANKPTYREYEGSQRIPLAPSPARLRRQASAHPEASPTRTAMPPAESMARTRPRLPVSTTGSQATSIM